ncbi:Gfo/Idh/MocA family oxidoreductase [Bartonella sp. HY329]|uniref:Gfo/Idh/MocA family protein n=1 Tax=unclassified Bartonella TaxID=2645622 RepID=UPI0021C9DB22|nr:MULTISPECIES: Gfo/Idh/MocA family oxidoreductase [unclassified Bartonella]UXM94429.1 Gfo/Idh/MocA family oxidoreductase [Bartonella sp. HY329]UXN08753.1 Gfo/Idh/MocA family oxidoreductase [Bartonella sp. HY328]
MTTIALMGAGRMAKVHAASILAAGAKIGAIYDPVQGAAEALSAEWGGKVTPTSIAAMNNDKCDAIMIATSSDTHIDLLKEAVKTQKPVLCEKPLAANFKQGLDFINDIGEAAARKIFVGFNRRFDRGHASVRHAVHDGKIGRLEQLIITSRDPLPPPLDYVPRSGGLFRDMMIHDFDMTRAIVNSRIVSVTAHGSSIIDPRIGELSDIDTASVTMLADDGTIITVLNSRRCAFGFDQRIEAFGANGMVVSDNPRQSGFVTFAANAVGVRAPILEFFMERYGPSYTAEIGEFINCAKQGLDMPINAIDGIMAAYLAEAADASLKQGKTINLKNLGEEF